MSKMDVRSYAPFARPGSALIKLIQAILVYLPPEFKINYDCDNEGQEYLVIVPIRHRGWYDNPAYKLVGLRINKEDLEGPVVYVGTTTVFYNEEHNFYAQRPKHKFSYRFTSKNSKCDKFCKNGNTYSDDTLRKIADYFLALTYMPCDDLCKHKWYDWVEIFRYCSLDLSRYSSDDYLICEACNERFCNDVRQNRLCFNCTYL